MRVVCHQELSQLPAADKTTIPVHLYGTKLDIPRIGHPIIESFKRLDFPVSQVSFDFVTIALAVTAADTFVLRSDTDDGWCRNIELQVAVGNPTHWKAALPILEKALTFLSGDVWKLSLVPGGLGAPNISKKPLVRPRGRGCDSVCLFSGGLDSSIGALDLIAHGKKPILVSHGYPNDQKHQLMVHAAVPSQPPHFIVNADPKGVDIADVSMRTRSLNFIAFAAAVGTIVSTKGSPVPLYMPENGVISINPPLTPRRIGSLSTRTTHPHYVELLQQLLDTLNVSVEIQNPYQFKTKGEMMADCADPASLAAIANNTVSCGKWKRMKQQCGRCVPCLIRRAAFHRAGMIDKTDYRFAKLTDCLKSEDDRDDLLAMMLAIEKSRRASMAPWVLKSGPLPITANRKKFVDVVSRGLSEMEKYLQSQGLPV